MMRLGERLSTLQYCLTVDEFKRVIVLCDEAKARSLFREIFKGIRYDSFHTIFKNVLNDDLMSLVFLLEKMQDLPKDHFQLLLSHLPSDFFQGIEAKLFDPKQPMLTISEFLFILD